MFAAIAAAVSWVLNAIVDTIIKLVTTLVLGALLLITAFLGIVVLILESRPQ